MSDITSVNGLDFQDQRAATAAPPGMARIQHVNGSFVSVAPDGTTSPIGGTSASDWVGQQLAHAQSLDPTLGLVSWCVTGFGTGVGTPPVATGLWFSAGAGIAILDTTDDGPPIRIASTASAGTTAFLQPVSGTPKNLIANAKTKGWYMVARMKPNAGDAQSLQELSLGGSTQEVDIAVDGSIDTANWRIVTRGGATTSVQGPAVDTANYHDLALWNNPLVALALYQDRVQKVQMTDLTNLTTQSAFPNVFVKNGTTAAIRQLDVVAIALFSRVPA